MTTSISEISSIIATCASKAPLVTRAYIYGSRLTDKFNKDSDLDIAVEIEIGDDAINVGSEYDQRIATWNFLSEKLKTCLKKKISFKIHLELLDGKNTPTIQNAVLRHSHKVYSRE